MVTPQPAVKPSSVQETILKFMNDGDTKKEAITRLEGILHCRIPETILNTIKEE